MIAILFILSVLCMRATAESTDSISTDSNSTDINTTTTTTTTRKPVDTWDNYYLPYIPDRSWADRYKGQQPHQLKRPAHRWWIHFKMTEQLLRLSEEIVIDCKLKMRHLEVIQAEYKQDENYELGVIAASVMEKFAHMVRIYRHFSQRTVFDSVNMQATENILAAYQVMLSDYNEIRIEKNLFYDVLKASSKKRAKANKDLAAESALQLASKYKDIREVSYDDLYMLDPKEIEQMKQARQEEIDKDKPPVRYFRRQNPKTNSTNVTFQITEEEYKRTLRQQKWMQKWKGFNPEIEGIPMSKKLAQVGLLNASNYLGLNAF